MRHLTILTLTAALFTTALAADTLPPDAEQQIAGAVTPAPEDLRDGATVLGRSGDDPKLITLRQGTGDLVCLADDPSDERFHVACYFKELEPFMARGRQLRAQGVERNEIRSTREKEIEAGTLDMPRGPTALYSYTGPAGSFDPATGTVDGANRVHVIYIPYATSESTGLSPAPATGTPWLMSPGKPWAHIMLVQPAATEEKEE